MTKVDEHIKTAQNMLNGIVERYYDLERENKKLKEENQKQRDRIAELEKCNLNLQEQIDKFLNRKQ